MVAPSDDVRIVPVPAAASLNLPPAASASSSSFVFTDANAVSETFST